MYAASLNDSQGTLNFADIEDWNFAEIESCKVADTIFSRDGKLPTLFSEGWKIANKSLRFGSYLNLILSLDLSTSLAQGLS